MVLQPSQKLDADAEVGVLHKEMVAEPQTKGPKTTTGPKIGLFPAPLVFYFIKRQAYTTINLELSPRNGDCYRSMGLENLGWRRIF